MLHWGRTITKKMETNISKKKTSCVEDWDKEQNKSWLNPIYKERITSLMTEYFHKVDSRWANSDSLRIANIVEKLAYKIVDVERIDRRRMSKDGLTFSFNVLQGVCSDELLDLLMEYQTEKWLFIQERFAQDGLVDLTYEDRYLNSPLGCLMLAQFIRRLRDLFKLQYRSIEIDLSKKDFRAMFDDNTLKIDQEFSCPENRDNFFKLCMDKIVRDKFVLKIGNTKHTRTLTVRNSTFELSISPDGGISHGWGIENRSHSTLTIDQLKEKLDVNIHCFNRSAHSFDRKGIPYVVKLCPIPSMTDERR